MCKIALISDIHFGKSARNSEFHVPGEYNPSAFLEKNESITQGLVNILKSEDIEYLFIAGDLTSCGSPQEFKCCQDKIIYIANESGIDIGNVIVSLGNHDVDWKVMNLYNEHSNSEENMNDYIKSSYLKLASNSSLYNMSLLKNNYDINGAESFSGVVEKDNFVVFVLNSGFECTPDEISGKINKRQLKWLEKNTRKYIEDNRWKIVLLHHHPFDYAYPNHYNDVSRLAEGPEFLDIVGKNAINIVLHGHRHHPKAKTTMENGWKNNITFICSGSLSVCPASRNNGDIPNTFHIIELLETKRDLSLSTYKFSDAEGWVPNEYSKNAPLDKTMKLGRVYSDEEIDTIIKRIEKNKPISYNDIDDKLKFTFAHVVDNKLKEFYGSKVVGKFRDQESILIVGDE